MDGYRCKGYPDVSQRNQVRLISVELLGRLTSSRFIAGLSHADHDGDAAIRVQRRFRVLSSVIGLDAELPLAIQTSRHLWF